MHWAEGARINGAATVVWGQGTRSGAERELEPTCRVQTPGRLPILVSTAHQASTRILCAGKCDLPASFLRLNFVIPFSA